MKKSIVGIFVGTAVLFVWGAISWMALPWHNMTMKKIGNEPEFAQYVIHNFGSGGVYFMPSTPHAMGGPMVLASIAPEGARPMGQAMAIAMLIQIAAAFLVSFLVYEGNVRKYRDRVGCVVVFALAAGFVCFLPNWNWWCFPTQYTIVNMMDLVIGWFLAGLAIAKIVAPDSAAGQP